MSTADIPTNFVGISGSFEDREDANDSVPISASIFFTSEQTQSQSQPVLERRSSISTADALRSLTSGSTDDTQSSLENSENTARLPQSGRSLSLSSSNVNDDHDHVTANDHQQFASATRADSVDRNHGEEALTASAEKAKEDGDDESSVKTPVVSSFSPSVVATPDPGQELTLDVPNGDRSPTDVSSLNTTSPSPYSGSLEIGERAYSEKHAYVVVPPLSFKDATTANASDPRAGRETNTTEKPDDSQGNISSANEPVSALGISGTNENRASTETVSIPNSVALPTDSAEKSPISPQATGSSLSSRRRSPPAPLPLQSNGAYSELSLDPKTGPKSFHVVVHGKQTQTAPPSSVVALPRTVAPRAQVVVVRPNTEPDTPGSPDLSALVAQAMFLEQRLLGGESDVNTPRADTDTFESAQSKAGLTDTSDESQVAFPHNEGHAQQSGNAPAPPTNDLNLRTSSKDTSASRKSLSWSSENASSEDSVPILTPPPLTEEPENTALERKEHDEPEGRQSLSSIMSSPRKKVLSLFSRTGRSGSTLELPGTFLLSCLT